MAHELPALAYEYNALEPFIDEQTLRLHHDKHHKAYVDGLNNAEAKLQEAREKADFALVKHWTRELAFHGSGHILHSLYWTIMAPSGNTPPGSPPTGGFDNRTFRTTVCAPTAPNNATAMTATLAAR